MAVIEINVAFHEINCAVIWSKGVTVWLIYRHIKYHSGIEGFCFYLQPIENV